jgi:predicted ABC-type ATPase
LQKKLYIIAGCNGAGKTTASFTILPDILDCKEFVNADEIARGLSPFQPEKVMFEAGRIMLQRINDLMVEGVDFAFETTLATRSYKVKIEEARSMGFKITLLFFWLRSDALAKERVKTRVAEGGHNIPPDIITRRYFRGIKNLFEIYLHLSDEVLIFDNSAGMHELIAEKSLSSEPNIFDQEKYLFLRHQYHEIPTTGRTPEHT